MNRDSKTNYHNSLKQFTNGIDPMMEKMRTSFKETQGSGFIGSLLVKPFTDMLKLPKMVRNIKNMNISALPILSGIGGAAGAYAYLGTWGIVGVGCSIFIMGYLFTLPYYFWKMSIIDSSHFHIKVYRLLRKKEYECFSRAFLYEDFSFSGLYDYVTALVTSQNQEEESARHLIEHFNSEKQLLKDMIEEIRAEKQEMECHLQEAQLASSEIVGFLLDDQQRLEKTISYLLDLIRKANTVLYRIKNGMFEPADLMIVSAFTIYELQDDVLVKIMDVGTSGASPKVISTTNPFYKDWAAVEVITRESNEPYYNNPYPGNVIVSYRMVMDKNKIWVYNFHIDERSEERALELTISDIIDSRVVYRLIHALCLLLQGHEWKGVVFDGQSSNG